MSKASSIPGVQGSLQAKTVGLGGPNPIYIGERKTSVEERALLASIIESFDEAIISKTLDGTIMSWNRGAEALYGYSAQEIIGRPVSILAPPDRLDEISDVLSRINVGERIAPLETIRVRKDGKRIDVSLTISPIRNALGEITGATSIARDMTLQKHAEETIRQSEEKYRTLFETLDQGVVYLKADTTITSANPAAQRILGLTLEQLRGRSIYDPRWRAIHEDGTDFPGQDHPVAVALRTGNPVQNVVMGVFNPQIEEIRWILITAVPQIGPGETNPDQVYATFSDITQRIRAEGALRKSEERYRQLLGSATDYIYSVKIENGRWVETSHSPGCLAVTGYSPEEYRDDPQLWYRMVHPSDQSAVIEQAEQARAGGMTQPLEHRIIHKDGSIRWLRNTIALHKNDAGQVLSYDGLVNDITERKKAEEILFKTEHQLRQSQKMEAIGRLAGGVAHDFNNLLTAIMGYADFLLMSLNPDDPRYSEAREIRKASEQAASLTRQLLAFSRKQDFQLRILDLNEVISDGTKILQRLIGEDIKLTTVLEPSLRPVKADPVQLEQVIINIAVNSRDAMPNGGKLLIQTANVDLEEEFCRHHPSTKVGPHVMLSISDSGCGMDAETQSRIFEPFFTTKEKGKGTGLGLSTVYGIIKQSEGSIWVKSELGMGTVFDIYLPSAEGERGIPNGRITEKQQETITGTECILLVEDEEVVRNLVRDTLVRSGYKVLEAQNGQEALNLANQYRESIHLMVTDVVMPEINGRLLAELIATVRPEMRVLYMSGHTASAIAHLGILSPAMPFLQKPFSLDMLVRRVREVLDAPHPKNQPE